MIYSHFKLTKKPKKTIIKPSNALVHSIRSLGELMVIMNMLRVSINSFEHGGISGYN
jgi:hypothetical protein